jgi:hypothetical protein
MGALMRKSTVDVRRWKFDLGRFDEPDAPADPVDPLADPPADPPTGPPADPDPKPDKGDSKDLTAELAKWKAMARKHEATAKANSDAAKKLADLEEAQKSDTEKAISEAEKRGKATASQEFGQELAKAKFEAIAAGRIPDVENVVEDLNLAKFLDENGRPDIEAITASVERFVALVPPPVTPAPPKPKPDPSQGPRGGEPKPTNFKDADQADFEKELATYGLKARS